MKFKSAKLVFFLLLLAPMGFAQLDYNKDSLIYSKITELKSFWQKYQYVVDEKQAYTAFENVPDLYVIHAKDTLSYNEYLQKVTEAQLNRQKKDVGVDINASYVENLDPGYDDQNLVYKRRFQAGVDWDILSSGYVESRNKQRILENEKIIQQLQPEKELSGADFSTISHKIIYLFNAQKLKLLKERQQILNDKMAVANELYLLKHLSRIDLLDIMQQQVDVQSMYRVYGDYNQQLSAMIRTEELPSEALPSFDLNLNDVFGTNEAAANDSILKLKIKNLELDHKAINDIKLTTQFKYNFYDLTNTTLADRAFLSAGLGLSVPIPLGVKANKSVVQAQSNLLSYQYQSEKENKDQDLLNLFYEFRYKLKQYDNFFEKEKRYQELLRIERVKDKFGDLEFNPLSALDLLDELLTVRIEQLDLQQQMYLQLLTLHNKLPAADLKKIIVRYQPDTMAIQPEKINRSMYVWSAARKKYSDDYLLEYFKLNKVSTAIVAVNKENNATELNSLENRLNAAMISVEWMSGNNHLLGAKHPELYYDSVLSGLELSPEACLHLDVEPQAKDDWQVNKEKYQEQYVELLRQTRAYCDAKKIKLAVSIPVYFSESTLTAIYALADKVYLMAYEHNDVAFVSKKIAEELAMGRSKTVVAIRAKDFENRKSCEQFIAGLCDALQLDNIAMHDFESFVRLDELSVNKEK